MDLILWRHADAEDGVPDEARALTARGEEQARRVAQWLAGRLPAGAVVLVSPARRAQQTARTLAHGFETTPEVGTASSPQAILRAAGWPAGGGAVLVVGHQPLLGQTAALLLAGEPREWAIRKGALWWLASRGRDEVIVRAVIDPELL